MAHTLWRSAKVIALLIKQNLSLLMNSADEKEFLQHLNDRKHLEVYENLVSLHNSIGLRTVGESKPNHFSVQSHWSAACTLVMRKRFCSSRISSKLWKVS